MSDSDFNLLPPWRNAARDLFNGKYTYGDIVPHEELQGALGLPKPVGKVEVEEYERWRLSVLSQMDALSAFLLEERSMCLRAIPGVGYQIVEPENQTAYAMKDGMRRMRGELRKMGRRLSHVNRSALTAEQARENADAMARLAFLSQQTNKVRRLRFTD